MVKVHLYYVLRVAPSGLARFIYKTTAKGRISTLPCKADISGITLNRHKARHEEDLR
jgi:hypothetical protein